MSVIHTGSFGQLWPISWTITHCFGVLEWFPWLTNPVVRLCVGHQHSQFWPILTRILDYYSLFWGLEQISIVVEPQGALTCRSSTLAVLADFGPFHGLLLTVLGSRCGFHGKRTMWCVYVSVINTDSLGRFWPVSLIITHRFRVTKQFP